MAQTKPNKDQEKIIKLAHDRFAECLEVDDELRKERLDDIRFVRLNQQWTDDVRLDRSRPGQERPMLTIDRLSQFRNQVINDLRQNGVSIKARPLNGEADEEVSEILNGIYRNIQNNSEYEIAVDTAVEAQVDTGLGYFRIITRYEDDDSFNQEPAFKAIPDSFKVYFDPASTMPDGSDANWAMVVEDVKREYFEEKYPGIDPDGWESKAPGDLTGWSSDKTVRIAEYFTITTKLRDKVFTKYGQTAYLDEMPEDQKGDIVKTRRVVERKCQWYKLGGSAILEQTELPCSYIPIIPVYGSMVWVEGKRYCYGLIRKAKDAQRVYNVAQSGNHEVLSLSPKTPFIAAEGQIDNYPEWENANRVNYSVLVYSPQTIGGHLAPPPQRTPPVPANPGYEVAMNRAIDDIKASIGMYDASLGNKEADQSGRAILAQQSQAANANFHFQDNLARSVRHAGRIILEMIPRLYDTRRIVRIMGFDKSVEMAEIDVNQPQALTEEQDQQGNIKRIFNPTIGKYDVYIDVGPNFATKRQEAANQIMELTKTWPELRQLAGDRLITNLDIDDGDEIAERLKKMLPPQLQEMPGGKGKMSPELQQATQHISQLAEQMEHMSQIIQELKNENALKWYDAETKRIIALKDEDLNKGKLHSLALDNLAQLINLSNPPQAQESTIDAASMNNPQGIQPNQPEQQQNLEGQEYGST